MHKGNGSVKTSLFNCYVHVVDAAKHLSIDQLVGFPENIRRRGIYQDASGLNSRSFDRDLLSLVNNIMADF